MKVYTFLYNNYGTFLENPFVYHKFLRIYDIIIAVPAIIISFLGGVVCKRQICIFIQQHPTGS